MTWEAGRFRCGLVLTSDQIGGPVAILLRDTLAIGKGCDSDD